MRTVWTEIVRAVRGTVGSGGSRRRAPYGGLRSGEPALAGTATDEARPEGRRLLVAFDEGDEGGHLAFSLTGLFHG